VHCSSKNQAITNSQCVVRDDDFRGLCVVVFDSDFDDLCFVVVVFGGGDGGLSIVVCDPTGPEQTFPFGQHPMTPLLPVSQ
jgi:hypothetical protein